VPPFVTRPQSKSPRERFGVAFLTFYSLLLGLAVTVRANAAPYGFNEDTWEGSTAFVETLVETVGRDHVVTTADLRWSQLRPEDAIVVLYPLHPLNPDELSAFLRSGGRVAILDDFGASEANLNRFQIERIPAPRRPARSLRNNPALALAEPVSDMAAGKAIGVHPVVANVGTVLTNHASALTHPNLTPALRIAAVGEPDGIIAVAGQVGRGRLFVVSDSSIVINQMMRYPGNRAFAQGLGRYLVADDTWGERQGKIYVLARKFEESGVFGNRSSIAKSLGAVVRDLRQWLAETRDAGLPPVAALILGALACLASLLWVSSTTARIYRRRPPRFARPVPLVAQGGVAGRAAVLAAPTTHRALALLELKSALEEAVAARFELNLPLSAPDLLDAVRNAGVVDDSELRILKKLMFKMGMIETSVAAGRPIRVRERDVKSAAERVDRVIASIDQKGRNL
jgi:Domain of unknown function (DUF4350)